MTKYADLLARRRKEFANRFDSSKLFERWIPAYNSGERIRVMFPGGETKTGTVGVTYGWVPVFLLIRNSRSVGSSDVLDANVVFSSSKVGYEVRP